mmetsp:Transcript_17877/g.47200  ORF Transcript_17877/g.47200 Transcript_17877/m.47200 type:complete len:402 (-) Transcript_17877:62-1267(-)
MPDPVLSEPAAVLAEAAPAATLAFAKMQEKYRWDPAIEKYFLLSLRLETVTDFQHLFSDAKEVADLINRIPSLGGPALQVSRVRQAWSGICDAAGQADLVKKRGIEAEDMDALLLQSALDSLEAFFWTRHHLRFAPEVEPSDYVINRLNKEMTKRLLTVQSVWKVRTMTHQLRAERKRQKLANGIELVHQEHEATVVIHPSLAAYLDQLLTLCIAYVRAGARPTGAVEVEDMKSESPAFVQCPLDIMLRYHHRATRQAALVKSSDALEWLTRRDEEERILWVDKHRSSASTFGSVVATMFERREAMWQPPPAAAYQTPIKPPKPGGQLADAAAGAKGSGKGSDQARAEKLGNKELCRAYNVGKCKEPCPANRLHVFNVITRSGKTCGMKNHTAGTCRNAGR